MPCRFVSDTALANELILHRDSVWIDYCHAASAYQPQMQNWLSRPPLESWNSKLERRLDNRLVKQLGTGGARQMGSQKRHPWEGMLKGQAEKAGFRAHLRGMALLRGRPRPPAHSR